MKAMQQKKNAHPQAQNTKHNNEYGSCSKTPPPPVNRQNTLLDSGNRKRRAPDEIVYDTLSQNELIAVMCGPSIYASD